MLSIPPLNDDVIMCILNNVTDPTIYMNCLYICKRLYDYLMKKHEHKIESFNMGIFGLFRRKPNLPWHKLQFRYNNSIRLKDLNYEEFHNRCSLSLFKDANDKIYDKYRNVKFFTYLSLWHIREIIKDKEITTIPSLLTFMEDVATCCNPNVTFEDKFLGMTILELSKIKRITSCLKTSVSLNPNITIKIVLDNVDFEWNWPSLSTNRGIKLEDMLNNLQLPWKLDNIYLNPSITVADYFKHNNLFNPRLVDQYKLFSRIRVDMKDFELYPTLFDLLYSNFNSFVCNNSLTLEMFDSMPFPRNYRRYSLNKNLTLSYVINNMNSGQDWNWCYLSNELYK